MNCRGVSRRLSAYIDDELSPGIKGSVEGHLGSCPVCKRKLAELTAISQAARALPPLKVSDGFKERVLESTKVGQVKKIVFSGVRVKAALAGLAFVAAAAVVFFVVGPKAPTIMPEMFAPTVTADIENTVGQSTDSVDFTQDPTRKIESFPIPKDAMAIDFAINDSSLLNDSMKIEDYILPVIEKTKENVNVKF